MMRLHHTKDFVQNNLYDKANILKYLQYDKFTYIKVQKKTKPKNQICLKFFKNTQISQTVRIKFKIHHLAFKLWEY